MSDMGGGTSMLEGPPKPPIDPRFVRRWVDARREEGRRRLRILVMVAASIGLVAVAAGSLLTPLAKVRHVRVEVVGSTPVATVVADAGLAHETLMIHADPSSIEHRLDDFASLGAARVKRVWPATIEVVVATRYPLAEISIASGPHAGQWAAVDPTGRVLSDSDSVPAGTPAIYGIASVPDPRMWLRGSPGATAPLSGGGVDMDAASDSPNLPSGISLVPRGLVRSGPVGALRGGLRHRRPRRGGLAQGPAGQYRGGLDTGAPGRRVAAVRQARRAGIHARDREPLRVRRHRPECSGSSDGLDGTVTTQIISRPVLQVDIDLYSRSSVFGAVRVEYPRLQGGDVARFNRTYRRNDTPTLQARTPNRPVLIGTGGY